MKKTEGKTPPEVNISVQDMMTVNATARIYSMRGNGLIAIYHCCCWEEGKGEREGEGGKGGEKRETRTRATRVRQHGDPKVWTIHRSPSGIQAGFLNWTQGATGILYYLRLCWSSGTEKEKERGKRGGGGEGGEEMGGGRGRVAAIHCHRPPPAIGPRNTPKASP